MRLPAWLPASYRRPESAPKAALLTLLAPLVLLTSSASWAALSCTVSATTVAFGTYNPIVTTPTDSTGTVTVTCKGAASATYSILLSAGSSGTYSLRRMPNSSGTLAYQLYTDAAHTLVWGDGANGNGTSVVSDTRTIPAGQYGVTNYYTIYGRIPARQTVSAGTYSDTLTVTVNY